MVVTASLLGVQHERVNEENKPVFICCVLNATTSSLCGRQMAGQCNLSFAVAQCDERPHVEPHELIGKKNIAVKPIQGRYLIF